MIYPFIYTRTLNKDYRLLTSGLLGGIPAEAINRCRAIARAMIDANDDLLQAESIVVVRQGTLTLVGKACLNRILGHPGTDLYGRVVRGFFGFIADSPITEIPAGNDYYSALYKTYVEPVWETYSDSEQVGTLYELPFGSDVISASEAGSTVINHNRALCGLYPATTDARALIAAVLATPEDNSIATNIHSRRQLTLTTPEFCFMNAVMGRETGLAKPEIVSIESLKAGKGGIDASSPGYARSAPTDSKTRDNIADGTAQTEVWNRPKRKTGLWTTIIVLLIIGLLIAAYFIFLYDARGPYPAGGGGGDRGESAGQDTVENAQQQPNASPNSALKPEKSATTTSDIFNPKDSVPDNRGNGGNRGSLPDIITENFKDNQSNPFSQTQGEENFNNMMDQIKKDTNDNESQLFSPVDEDEESQPKKNGGHGFSPHHERHGQSFFIMNEKSL